ncbi:CAP domain-containing protein [Micromonospora sp. HUAS LYJ1]|uniref:CAP domain-containing protein n=1 Tax=Micromonospora sp. HUAS LYJ1 TaxID=3061626 RepID=UPI0026741CD9|nr:CAP domain-containing protein [Micromonospora sp. HUAS LYJ1]WKU08737.1 CAP domain-containing protein [Micromonospora sp. HUAS LYJ1]
MYGWTDPNDQDAAYRRPQPSTDDPAWLTDRPAPRSAYLFGDEPAVDAPAPAGPGGTDAAAGSAGGTPGPAADRWADAPRGQHPTGPSRTWQDEQTGAWQDEQTGWQDAPTGRWNAEPAGQWAAAEQAGAWPDDRDERWTGGRDEPAEQWQEDRTDRWQDRRTGAWQDEQDDRAGAWQDEQDDRAGAWQGQAATGQARQEPWQGRPDGSWSGDGAGRWAQPQAGPWHDGVDRATGPDGPWTDTPAEHDGRQAYPVAGPVRAELRDATVPTPAGGPVDGVAATGRTRRRSRRPVLIGGAAAAATLVVSLGIGALLLPDDDGNADRAALDEPVATAPVIPDTAPDTSAPASPSATPSPSPTSASPSPSRTATPTPTPSRTQAASRQTARGGSGTVPPAAPTTRAAVSGGGGGSQAQQVVDLVNAERAKAGCAAVTVNAKLTLAAQQHSQDQADHQTMTHTGSDGSNAGQRLDRAGYTWRTYGENVAWNQQTPAAVMQAWMNSSGHRANILNCAFTEIGVGVATGNGPYWTQDFAAPR